MEDGRPLGGPRELMILPRLSELVCRFMVIGSDLTFRARPLHLDFPSLPRLPLSVKENLGCSAPPLPSLETSAGSLGFEAVISIPSSRPLF